MDVVEQLVIERVRAQVAELTKRFPVYSWQHAEEDKVRNVENDATERLLKSLDDDSDDCGAMYEEVGRAVVDRLRRTDRDALRTIARAWVECDEAQAALLDLDFYSMELGAAKERGEIADAVLRNVVRKVVFKEST
ncbi:hypothetical protein BLA9940_05242 [Burkholderia aenigmatica]|nr:hypothetical protein BLA9940_05242 [Burkholderia aenigmatica]